MGTPVGVDAGASLLGAAIVSSALSGEASKRRRRRDTSLSDEERQRMDEAALAALQVGYPCSCLASFRHTGVDKISIQRLSDSASGHIASLRNLGIELLLNPVNII